MSKVASVISMEFETPEQVTAFTHYVTEAHEDLSRELKQLTAVRTGETSVFVIRVHKDQESYERYDMAMRKKRDQNPHRPRDVLKLEGDVSYMFHHTKYLNV